MLKFHCSWYNSTLLVSSSLTSAPTKHTSHVCIKRINTKQQGFKERDALSCCSLYYLLIAEDKMRLKKFAPCWSWIPIQLLNWHPHISLSRSPGSYQLPPLSDICKQIPLAFFFFFFNPTADLLPLPPSWWLYLSTQPVSSFSTFVSKYILGFKDKQWWGKLHSYLAAGAFGRYSCQTLPRIYINSVYFFFKSSYFDQTLFYFHRHIHTKIVLQGPYLSQILGAGLMKRLQKKCLTGQNDNFPPVLLLQSFKNSQFYKQLKARSVKA